MKRLMPSMVKSVSQHTVNSSSTVVLQGEKNLGKPVKSRVSEIYNLVLQKGG